MAKKQNEIDEVDLSLAPDPTPAVGDTVNYVSPQTRKIVPIKVSAVPDGHDGKVVALDLGTDKEKKIVRVPHRPKEAIAGNTWHWPSKAVAILIGLFVLAFALMAKAVLPTYHTFSAYGNAAAGATIIMPADPNSQIRVISIFFSSDNVGAQMNFSSGVTAYSLITNTASSSAVTNYINSTNGLIPLAGLILQQNGLVFTNQVVTFGTYISGTNTSGYVTNQAYVTTLTGGWGVIGLQGGNIYQLGPVTSLFPGVTTNAYNGDDIYSGNYGRPVLMTLGPATTTNRLSYVGTHYDSQSQ